MKQCPTCKNTYTDDSLAFCLSDGTTLVSSQTEEVTQQISAANNPIRVNIAPETSPNAFTPAIQPQPKGGKGWIIGALVGLFLLVIIGIGGVGAFVYMKSGEIKPVAVVENKADNKPISNMPTAANTATPTPDEIAALKQKQAELEKQLKDQKGKVPTVPTLPNSPAAPKVPTVTTAKVNSPGDGFLALRTGPSAETGERIMEIPHGATVTVLACQAAAKGKKGKWCKVNYNGNAGWAFDGFLIY
jgi:Bacterial SH3 domain